MGQVSKPCKLSGVAPLLSLPMGPCTCLLPSSRRSSVSLHLSCEEFLKASLMRCLEACRGVFVRKTLRTDQRVLQNDRDTLDVWDALYKLSGICSSV